MPEHPQLAGAISREMRVALERTDSAAGDAFGPHGFADFDASHCRWRGPSWFSLKADGTVEAGAILLTNTLRTASLVDIRASRNFMLYWDLFDAGGLLTCHGRMRLAKLKYGTQANNVARRRAGNPSDAASIGRSTRCIVTRRFTEAVDPSGYEPDVVDIPWIPPAAGALRNIPHHIDVLGSRGLQRAHG